MSLNHSIRTVHRWTSIVFIIPVIANFAIYAQGKTPPAYITYAPLFPLALLTLTGLYMFFLPYLAKPRNG